MTQLSTVLERMRQHVSETELKSDILPMPPLGSMEGDGNQITVSQPGVEKVRETLPPSISPKDCENITKATRSEIADMVNICYNALDTYGKTPEQMQSTVKLFCLVLEGQELPKVRSAFREWVTRNSKLPTPADIMNIIDPPKQEWKPDWPMYVAIKRKIANDGYYVYGEERDFLRRCERFALDRAKEGIEPESVDEGTVRLFARGEIDEQKLLN